MTDDVVLDLPLMEVINASPQSALLLDGKHRVVHANDAFLHRVARSAESVQGAYINVLTNDAHALDFDALTGLPVRSVLAKALQSELQNVSPENCVAVFTVEICGLKRVNDGLGRAFGDVLLRAAAQRLLSLPVGPGLVARISGAEFSIMFAGISGVNAGAEIAATITERLSEPFEVVVDHAGNPTPIHVRSLVGLAVSTDPNDDAAGLMSDAEAALAHLRNVEGGTWELFAPHMRDGSRSSFANERALRRAIDNKELRVFYQPEVWFSDGKTIGAEALVRWQHPQNGLLTAAGFVHIAEETGLVVPIGWWVLQEACRQAAEWQASGRDVTIRVNLSGRQVAHPDLIFEVAGAIEESGVNPEKLCLEITETVLMSDAKLALERLCQLKELGLHLAIDDFGTGYSSLSYLKRFPVDVLKIDKSFVDGLAHSSQDRSIVKAIVDLAHAMDLEVTAEGIEEAAQIDVLRDLGCHRGQGFWFHRPLPAEKFPINNVALIS